MSKSAGIQNLEIRNRNAISFFHSPTPSFHPSAVFSRPGFDSEQEWGAIGRRRQGEAGAVAGGANPISDRQPTSQVRAAKDAVAMPGSRGPLQARLAVEQHP